MKASISLTDTQAAFARRLVEEGRYPSLNAVVQQGIEALKHEDDAFIEGKAAFASLMKARIDGSFVPAARFRASVEDMLEEEAVADEG